MRSCKIQPPLCARADSAPCCVDCREPQCRARCQNDPARCKCWVDKPPKREPVRRVDPLHVAYLYSQGLPVREIAARLGCGRSTVYDILRKAGVSGRG